MKLYDSISGCEYKVIYIYENSMHEKYIFYSSENQVYVSFLDEMHGGLKPVSIDKWTEIKQAFYEYRHSPEEGCQYCACEGENCDCMTCTQNTYY